MVSGILLGFKDLEEAQKARKYFNGTYMGTSKIEVEFAKTRDELLEPKEKYQKKSKRPPAEDVTTVNSA